MLSAILSSHDYVNLLLAKLRIGFGKCFKLGAIPYSKYYRLLYLPNSNGVWEINFVECNTQLKPLL